MTEQENYALGDIIRWKSSRDSGDYDYGMVIREPEIVTRGTYTSSGVFADLVDYEIDTFRLQHPLCGITVFSFAQQKVVTIYRNPEDVPLFIEKVNFSKENA